MKRFNWAKWQGGIGLCVAGALLAECLGLTDVFMVAKPIATLSIFLLPYFFAPPSKERTRFLSALFFCLVGDVLLLFDGLFLAGLIAFLIAHLLLIHTFKSMHGWRWDMRILLPLVLFGGLIYAYLFAGLGLLKVPVAGYVLVIVIMSWQGIATARYVGNRAWQLIALGCILFMISDAALAVFRFRLEWSYSGLLVLSTYWSAIWLLAVGATRICLAKKKKNGGAIA
ncbi:MAG: lysoplasmalogenase [Saprospiraceae bacterium]|nr:lysoplasmalogenase [Saprospiraceae bacterium]